MLEYGVKQIITNPTLITKSNDIIRLIDSRNNQTRAFVLPASYEAVVERLSKEIEYKIWVQEKKRKIKNHQKENLDYISKIGIESINEYLQ